MIEEINEKGNKEFFKKAFNDMKESTKEQHEVDKAEFAAAMMVLAFFVGSLIGGAVSGLPFDTVGFGALDLVMCVISKVALVGIFVPIYLVMSVAAKQRLWLSILLSMAVGMFLFMMIPMLTPLDATVTHVFICLLGGTGISFGLGALSTLVLKKTSLV